MIVFSPEFQLFLFSKLFVGHHLDLACIRRSSDIKNHFAIFKFITQFMIKKEKAPKNAQSKHTMLSLFKLLSHQWSFKPFEIHNPSSKIRNNIFAGRYNG